MLSAMTKHPRVMKKSNTTHAKSTFYEFCLSELELLNINIELPRIPINESSRAVITSSSSNNEKEDCKI